MKQLYPTKILLAFAILSMACLVSRAQTNMHFSDPAMTTVFSGNYDPSAFPLKTDYGKPQDIIEMLEHDISPDSLQSYLIGLNAFHTRNAGSDTLSTKRGIGAARNWIKDQFSRFAVNQGGNMLAGFFEFDQDICGVEHHKNVVAMLPGSDPKRGAVIIEAHMDSRCSEVCDTSCVAKGMEDNGSGVALVMELARVLSRYNYPETFLFVATTGEEQGLVGANALAEYVLQNDVPLLMVQNNDIVGGILCGETSSPPSCPGPDDVDSTQVRLFSSGGYNSPHKAICRFAKLQYEEMLKPVVDVPMTLTIMSAEDREGRGGDHIPFHERNYPAMRFTSANEHGDAGVGPDYHDRQHTSDDILGVDTDGDMELDSFFVDFNYLARNSVINAATAVLATLAPDEPEIGIVYFDRREFYIEIQSEITYPEYRIGIRTDFNDYDTIYSIKGGNSGVFKTQNPELFIFLTVMSVDSNGLESFSKEETRVLFTSTQEIEPKKKAVELLQNKPNPFDESTILSYWVNDPLHYRNAYIIVTDMTGKEVDRLATSPQEGMNEVVYFHGYRATGTFVYTLVIDGAVVDQKRMIFAN